MHKVHLGIDAATPEIPAMEVTDNSINGDAPMLPDLLSQIPLKQQIASISGNGNGNGNGNGAYDTKACHKFIALGGADAIIPRRNVKPWKTGRLGARARNEIMRALRRPRGTIWKK
jgi:hypothetical protein